MKPIITSRNLRSKKQCRDNKPQTRNDANSFHQAARPPAHPSPPHTPRPQAVLLPLTRERRRQGLGCSLPGLARFPLQRRFTPPLREALRHRRPRGAGFTAGPGTMCGGPVNVRGYWPRFTPSATGRRRPSQPYPRHQ